MPPPQGQRHIFGVTNCSRKLADVVSTGPRDSRGRRRARSIINIPEGRTPNGYDHLIDSRVYSPNQRPRRYVFSSVQSFSKHQLGTPPPQYPPSAFCIDRMLGTTADPSQASGTLIQPILLARIHSHLQMLSQQKTSGHGSTSFHLARLLLLRNLAHCTLFFLEP